ncbi:hypothetical protein EEB12_28885 [Rhodococcus sp. WS1]|nr:hypothetical protein EEB12_28885 [Rhodococcus sp. WS1]
MLLTPVMGFSSQKFQGFEVPSPDVFDAHSQSDEHSPGAVDRGFADFGAGSDRRFRCGDPAAGVGFGEMCVSLCHCVSLVWLDQVVRAQRLAGRAGGVMPELAEPFPA